MTQENKTFSNQQNINPEGRQRRPSAVARNQRDQTARKTFLAITVLPLVLIVAITVGLFVRAWPILSSYPLKELFFGSVWKPDEGLFGFWPFITGTFWVTGVGVLLAVPPCLLVALYLSEYAHSLTRSIAKPVLDLLAAIPPVVYGVWGLLAIVPFVDKVLAPFSKQWLNTLPFLAVNQPTGFSILSAGIVIAVMIAPLIISVVYEVFATVPSDLRHASLAIGATQWETIRYIVIPRVLPGIVAAVVLGASRAVGETIAVLMVVGNVAKVPHSIFDAAYPLPALIANNYGDMMSIPLYDAALLCAALVLLVIILFFNILSTIVLQRFLERRQA
jgi:phosphate transport system permease protein